MGIKSWIINKLEEDVEYSAGHIELENLTETDREKLFEQFGEGDDNLTNFLKSAYRHGLPSIFCCSGHGFQSAYVILKITDQNIEIAKKVGKILSKQCVATNFTDDYIRGKYVDYRSMKSVSTEWLNTATQILENPELFEDIEPDIYYHEEMLPSRKPFLFDLKKRILTYLRGTKEISELTIINDSYMDTKKTWELSNEEKESIHLGQNYIKTDISYEKLYKESIILIGPSGAGKSTVAEELRQITNMPRLCLDKIANNAKHNGIMNRFKNADEFNFYMISEVLKKVKEDNSYGIVDFGAGHSIYEDREIFEKVKAMLQPFKNIILLLPSQNKTEALSIMEQRATGDTRDNRRFIESPCNKELATMTIYGNGRQPLEIAEEILSRIKNVDKEQITLE